ncbi:hypothetical protein MRX96_013362 [Rhipicephalus microplus]
MMSNPEREFRTRTQDLVRKTLVANFKKRSIIQQNPRDATFSAAHGEVVGEATTEGLATASVVTEPVRSLSPAESSGSGHVRLDTIYRQKSDLEEERAKGDDKLSELSSAAATERKRAFVVDGADEAARPPDGTTFTIIDLETVNQRFVGIRKNH